MSKFVLYFFITIAAVSHSMTAAAHTEPSSEPVWKLGSHLLLEHGVLMAIAALMALLLIASQLRLISNKLVRRRQNRIK